MNRLIFALALVISAATACTSSDLGAPVAQSSVNRIEAMPNMPQPYKIIDWRQKTLDFDAYVFDFNSTLPAGPAIWLDDSRRNIIVIPIIVDVIGFALMTIPYLFWDYDSKKQNMVMEVLKRRAEVTEKKAAEEGISVSGGYQG